MDSEDVRRWVEGYIRAWESNDPGDIGALFADDARYFTAPFGEPWRGREAIVAGWIENKDEPGDHTFRFEVLAVAGDLGFVQGWTHYNESANEPAKDYVNLWVIRFAADGRCAEFTEWWMRHRKSGGA